MFSLHFRETRTYRAVRTFTERHERFFMPAMLLAGTSIDALQFRWLDLKTTFIISSVYATICAAAMILSARTIKPEQTFLRYAQLLAPFFYQFTIGALLSTSLLFYWFNSSFSVSWPIIVLIALVMLFNEAFRDLFDRPTVQIALFAFVLFSLSTTFSAYGFNSLSPSVFLFGGIVSAAFVFLFIAIYHRATKRSSSLIPIVLVVYFVMNALYFGKIIPPIPLALKEAGMYTAISINYTLEGPGESGIERWIPGQTFSLAPGEPLYAYTAIYAPTDLSTLIVHDWQYYDETQNDWISKSRLTFAIRGGREEGYRGYSTKSALQEGAWRVSVETENGQILGRIPFTLSFVGP